MADRTLQRIGMALTAPVALFWVMDTAMKLAGMPQVAETMAPLGWPTGRATILSLGVVQAVSLVLYLVPRTAALGAILLTADLGGAIATHARIGSPLPTHTLFGVYVGVCTWAVLWLRVPALRALIPVRTGKD